ncbi:hypothetical protein [Roseofilum casamattae]|uniref:Uncharacterized protein n=1 Tax=Roseofilum casamattae BLCC-M143 TaxID=3022442 RepID=A0ABT7C348_9CYAN|nr:hypothetical protein [Roseofilum casamattae]MDJ1185883.1 hypothetical protein [Roseofilum casamattae BLCC-M143]
MSIVVIGDRAVGKTHMALALAELPTGSKVRIIDPSAEVLREELINPDTGATVPTSEIISRPIRLEVQLDRRRIIDSVWVDTPGEIWEPDWPKDHPDAWNKFKQNIARNLAIILLLPPYQEMVSQELINRASSNMRVNRERLMNYERWCRNLEGWLKFLNQYCSRVHNIAICLHKADLFCESMDAEASTIIGHPVERQSKIRNRFFAVAKEVIDRHNREERPFQFFITSVSDTILLTAPWLSLSPFLLYRR